MSPGFTSAPMRTMPLSSRSFRASSPTFGMSRVTSSLPSFVSRATHSNSSMWIEVKTSSFGDALGDEDRVLEVVALPRHERDEHVLAERELAHVGRRTVREDVARLHALAGADDRLLVEAGRLVGALELVELVDVRDLGLVALGRNDDARASTLSTMPSRFATTQTPESRASLPSMPVPTSGAQLRMSGTA
jgi:hypothetical protein